MLKTTITPEMHYDDWARAYDGDVQGWDYHAPDRLLRRAADFLKTHDGAPRLLDVGIGTGLFSEKCRGVRPDLHVTGVDISERMLGVCRRKGVADELHRVDIAAERFPYADNSFDVAAASGVMENVEDIGHAVREMARVVRHGGLVLFTYMPAHGTKLREPKTMKLRPGRTRDGKFVMGNLTLYRHNAANLDAVAREASLRPAPRDSFVGYRTYVVVAVLYDLFAAHKIRHPSV